MFSHLDGHVPAFPMAHAAADLLLAGGTLGTLARPLCAKYRFPFSVPIQNTEHRTQDTDRNSQKLGGNGAAASAMASRPRQTHSERIPCDVSLRSPSPAAPLGRLVSNQGHAPTGHAPTEGAFPIHTLIHVLFGETGRTPCPSRVQLPRRCCSQRTRRIAGSAISGRSTADKGPSIANHETLEVVHELSISGLDCRWNTLITSLRSVLRVLRSVLPRERAALAGRPFCTSCSLS
jgi:hypothetical protein